jgi:hypothetical protein
MREKKCESFPCSAGLGELGTNARCYYCMARFFMGGFTPMSYKISGVWKPPSVRLTDVRKVFLYGLTMLE